MGATSARGNNIYRPRASVHPSLFILLDENAEYFTVIARDSSNFDFLFSDLGRELANIDYIVALINQKLCENVEDEKSVELLGSILNDIKLVLTEPASGEIH